jgi:hypothetical protein
VRPPMATNGAITPRRGTAWVRTARRRGDQRHRVAHRSHSAKQRHQEDPSVRVDRCEARPRWRQRKTSTSSPGLSVGSEGDVQEGRRSGAASSASRTDVDGGPTASGGRLRDTGVHPSRWQVQAVAISGESVACVPRVSTHPRIAADLALPAALHLASLQRGQRSYPARAPQPLL